MVRAERDRSLLARAAAAYRAALDIAHAFRLEAAQAELLQSLDSLQEELTAVNRKKSELSEQVADLKRETSELNLKLEHSESEESALQCSFDKQATCMHASLPLLRLSP